MYTEIISIRLLFIFIELYYERRTKKHIFALNLM